jgi:hypothetical protein
MDLWFQQMPNGDQTIAMGWLDFMGKEFIGWANYRAAKKKGSRKFSL